MLPNASCAVKKCAVLTPCNTPVHASADLFTIPLPSDAEHAQQTLVAVVPARGTNCVDAEIALCIEFVSPHDIYYRQNLAHIGSSCQVWLPHIHIFSTRSAFSKLTPANILFILAIYTPSFVTIVSLHWLSFPSIGACLCHAY